MEHKPKALPPVTQPVAQPVPVVRKSKKVSNQSIDKMTLEQAEALATARGHGKPETLVPSASTPLVFIHGNKVVAVTQAQFDAKAQANAQADAQAQNEKEFAQSQRMMKRQPKHIQSLGRNLWKLWG